MGFQINQFIMLTMLEVPIHQCTLYGRFLPLVGNRSHPKNLETISAIRKDIPSYERRITKREFKNAFGFFAPSYILRNIFKNLTNDQSAAHDFNEAEIDRRLEFSLMTGDEGIMVDLRQQKSD